MGLQFFVGEVQGQINDAVRAKNEGQRAIEQLQSSISQFLSAPLSGKAYTSAKNYFQVAYTPLCRAAIMSGEALVSAHNRLLSEYQSTVGSIDTIEDQLLDQIRQLESLKSELNRQMSEAKRMRPDLERRYINACDCITKRRERLQKFHDYNTKSASFFNEYDACQQQYLSGLAQVQNSKAWNSASGTFDLGLLDMSWATSVNEHWNQRAQDLEKKQKELEMNMGFSNPKYEIRSVPGPYGEDIYEVYVNGVLDQEATTQYNLDKAILKRDAILNAKWSTSDKVIAGILFLVGVTIATGGASAVITGILGVFEGSGSVLVALSNGTTALIPAIAVNKDALVKTAEGTILSVGGILAVNQSSTIMANSGGNGSADNLLQGNVDHGALHLKPDPTKPIHTQFNFSTKEKLTELLKEAWAKAGNGFPSYNGSRVYDIDMGRVIGTNGERTIRIVVDEFGKLVTTFPK